MVSVKSVKKYLLLPQLSKIFQQLKKSSHIYNFVFEEKKKNFQR